MSGKMSDLGTMPKKIMKSGRDAGEDEELGHDAGKDNEIRASTGEGSGKAPEKGRIQASTEKIESGRVPKRWNPGEYRKSRNLGEYRKRARIRASTGEGSG